MIGSVVIQCAADAGAHVFRDAVAGAAAARDKVAARRLDNFGSKYNRIGYFNRSDRHICRKACGSAVAARAKFIGYSASVNIYAPFAAVKNDFLFGDSNAFKFLGASKADAGLKNKFYVKTNCHLIKTAIELNRIHSDAGPKDLCALGSHIARAINDFLTKIGEIHRYVLKAVFITARVKDSVSIYANGFFAYVHIRQRSACAGTSVLSHSI